MTTTNTTQNNGGADELTSAYNVISARSTRRATPTRH